MISIEMILTKHWKRKKRRKEWPKVKFFGYKFDIKSNDDDAFYMLMIVMIATKRKYKMMKWKRNGDKKIEKDVQKPEVVKKRR